MRRVFAIGPTVEDLLGRRSVAIDRVACEPVFMNKVVLVTGAAGSIGSELCRRIVTFTPRQLVMVDNNESGLHDLVTELRGAAGGAARTSTVPVLADITSVEKMHRVFDSCRPEIVFHAAAYKHVPMLEDHPDEAVRVNLGGTQIVADLAVRFGIERFVLVSTDKAVDPSSVMGATKRVCELLIMAERRTSRPLFTGVRFGNVLGSRGSVVPTFERQIQHGGPVTITHPEMTRYFITVSDAASLIIQAAVLTTGGDVFTLDMGRVTRIEDLAHRLIQQRGFRPGQDISIEYTGTRPGEKLHEEPLGEGESRAATSHPQIFRITSCDIPARDHIQAQVAELRRLAERQQNDEIVMRLRLLVAENRLVQG